MNRLRELRKARRMTQVDIASMVGIGQSAYSFWESGRSKIDDASLRKLSAFYGVTVDYILGADDVTRQRAVSVPVLGDVAAGIPIEAVTDIVDYEEIDAAMAGSGEYFGLRIKGRSMEPRMLEGDVVIVRRQSDAETGDTVVVMVNGDSATVKRIKYAPEGITLIPSNPAYDVQFYSAADVERLPVRVIGKVVELRAKY